VHNVHSNWKQLFLESLCTLCTNGLQGVPDGADWVIFHARGAYDPTIRSRNDQPQTLDPLHPD
jgi:hypothetical protein